MTLAGPGHARAAIAIANWSTLSPFPGVSAVAMIIKIANPGIGMRHVNQNPDYGIDPSASIGSDERKDHSDRRCQ